MRRRILQQIRKEAPGNSEAVAECLPAVAHQFCAMHLLLNVCENAGSLFEPYFWKVVKARTPQEFDEAMLMLKGNNPKKFSGVFSSCNGKCPPREAASSASPSIWMLESDARRGRSLLHP